MHIKAKQHQIFGRQCKADRFSFTSIESHSLKSV